MLLPGILNCIFQLEKAFKNELKWLFAEHFFSLIEIISSPLFTCKYNGLFVLLQREEDSFFNLLIVEIIGSGSEQN